MTGRVCLDKLIKVFHTESAFSTFNHTQKHDKHTHKIQKKTFDSSYLFVQDIQHPTIQRS